MQSEFIEELFYGELRPYCELLEAAGEKSKILPVDAFREGFRLGVSMMMSL